MSFIRLGDSDTICMFKDNNMRKELFEMVE